MEITFESVSKQYKSKYALKNFTATLSEGVYGLLGENGAGKTTLINTFVGILRGDSGTIRVDGQDVRTLGKAFLSQIGYMPQYPIFYRDFTVRDFLLYMCALKDIPAHEGQDRVSELLATVNLTDAQDKKIGALSGGMRQRVGIVQAMLSDPKILILDEPTSGLDPGERVRFRNLLSEFAHDRIVLISTHIVSDVEYIAACHTVIKNGKLLATGTTEELVRLVDGKVWSCAIPAEDVPKYEGRLSIVSLRNESGGGVSIRYLAESASITGSVSAVPRLEDLYLWLFPQNSGENERRNQAIC